MGRRRIRLPCCAEPVQGQDVPGQRRAESPQRSGSSGGISACRHPLHPAPPTKAVVGIHRLLFLLFLLLVIRVARVRKGAGPCACGGGGGGRPPPARPRCAVISAYTPWRDTAMTRKYNCNTRLVKRKK